MNKVIIVEDEWIIRKSLRNAAWEYINIDQVFEASDGEEAIEIIKKEQPQVIISDINMPFMDGLEMAKIVKNISPKSRIIFLTGYDEFKFAQAAVKLKAFDYILKPVSVHELFEKVKEAIKDWEEEQRTNQTLENTLPLMQDQFFNKLIKYGHERLDIEKELSNLKIFLQGPNYTAFLIYTASENEKEDIENKKRLHKVVSNLLQNYNYALIQAGISYLCLMLSVEGESTDLKKKIAIQILKYAEIELNREIVITIGKTYGNLFEIGTSMVESKIAMDMRGMVQRQPVLLFEEIIANSKQVVNILSNFDKELERLIELEIPKKVKIVLDQLYSTLKTTIIPLQEIKIFAVKYITLFYFEIKKWKKEEMEQINVLELNNKIIKKQSVFNVIEELQRIVNEWISIVDYEREENYQSLVDKAIAYIKENYRDEDLTLQKVADAIHVSAPYLSNLFKREKGLNFSNYLFELRMKEAMYLLREKKEKTYIVAEKVGYKNPQYFSICFKKYTGYTPKEYKNII